MSSQTTHFTYPSADRITQIHAIEWKCAGEPAAIVQLVHGMQEFIDRYQEFAEYLNEQGILVVGNDHLGHGSSVADSSSFGYFAEKNGNKALLSDMHYLHRMYAERYPKAAYFIFGHSMGSFLARQYICMYGKRLAGAIICGTAYHSSLETNAGKLLCSLLAAVRGWRYQSRFITWMVLGSFNKKFEPARTKADWLTRDEKIVNEYIHDDRTHHMFTLNAYYNMFESMRYLTVKSNIAKVPKDLSILLVAGEMDPVGNFGAGVKRAALELKSAGIADVECVLYPNDRHEILNELDRKDVYKDLQKWISERVKGSDKGKGGRKA